jgi:phytoene dehydrogenase-like protein
LTNESIIIIGAGIGGLSAGCYAQMNGLESKIFEMHNIPGGQCTAWKRGGFTFDGCIHHLAGCKPEALLYNMWEELGALPTRKVIFPQDMCQVEDETGKRFTVYIDLERLQQHMLELAPEDTATINSYIKACRIFVNLDFLDTPLLTSSGFAKRFFKMMGLMKWQLPMAKFAEKFHNKFMHKSFPTIQYDWTDTPLFVHLNMIGNCYSHNYGVPEGGSFEFSRAIEQRYRRLSGVVNYNSKVEKILVENDRAVGIKLSDGSEHRADIIVSDAFGYSTIFNLLDGRYLDDKIKAQYAKPKDEIEMGLHVSFGLSRDLSNEPRALVLFLEEPINIANEQRMKLDLELFGYDQTVAPAGKSVLKVLLKTSYNYWKELHKNPEQYAAEKQQVAATVLKALEKRFPGLQDQVEVTDVATPMTTERYTGIGQQFEVHWGLFGTLSFIRSQPRTLPNLKGFYMVGGAAGLPGCAAQGRNAIQKICQQEGITFKATKP